jgi:hypothetical protein
MKAMIVGDNISQRALFLPVNGKSLLPLTPGRRTEKEISFSDGCFHPTEPPNLNEILIGRPVTKLEKTPRGKDKCAQLKGPLSKY